MQEIVQLSEISQKEPTEFYLTDDIDFSEKEGSFKIPSGSVLDGRGYTVLNLSNPLFTHVRDCVIKNIQFKDCFIDETGTSKHIGILSNKSFKSDFKSITIRDSKISGENTSLVGLLSGYGREINCRSVNSYNSTVFGQHNIAGLIGKSIDSKLTDCAVVSCEINGQNRVGGLVGVGNKDITIDCLTKNTTVKGVVTVGGMYGKIYGTMQKNQDVRGKIQNCVTKECVIKGSEIVGGFSGRVEEQGQEEESIINCKSDNIVRGLTTVGGFLGSAFHLNLKNCIGSGTVNSQDPSGFISELHNSTIKTSYCTTDLQTEENISFGFIEKVGEDSVIKQCFTLSQTDAETTKIIQTISLDSHVNDLYWNMDLCQEKQPGTYTSLESVESIKTVMLTS